MKAVIVGPFDPESLIGLQDIVDVVHITEVNRERASPSWRMPESLSVAGWCSMQPYSMLRRCSNWS
jgi:hypothetical protein